jgi:hypothetical protein
MNKSIATLVLVMAMAFIAYFAIGLATPVLPLHVHEALAAVPSLEASWPAACSQRGKS